MPLISEEEHAAQEGRLGLRPVGHPEGLTVTRHPFSPPLPGEEERKPPTWGETFGAAFDLENDVYNVARRMSEPDYGPADPEHNPLDVIKGTPAELYRDRFLTARNATETEAIKARIGRELESRRILEEAGLAGFGAAMVAGVLSPTSLLPFGAVYRGYRMGSAAARTALHTGAWGAGAIGIQEAALHSAQETRTLMESLIAVGGGAVLGGLLGAGASAFSTRTLARASRQIDADLATVRALRQEAETATPQPRIDPDEPPFGRPAEAPVEGAPAGAAVTRPMQENVLAGAFGLEKAFRRFNPLSRMIGSENRAARDAVTRMAEMPMMLEQNKLGIPTGPEGGSVEARIKIDGDLALFRAQEALHRSFSEHRFQDPNAWFAKSRAWIEGNGPNKLGYADFKREVTKALRSETPDKGIEHPIPEVKAAAEVVRRDVFDAFKNEAIKLGLFDKDADFLAGYVMRRYDVPKILAEHTRFRDILVDWLSKGQAKARRELAQLEAKLRQAQGQAEAAAPEIDRLRGEIEALKQRWSVDPAQVDSYLDMWRFAVNDAPKKPQTLAQWVRAQGGVRDTGRAVEHMLGSKKEAGSLINNKRGVNLDDITHRAWEAGFFGAREDRPDIREFLDLLDDDVRSGRVVRQGDEEQLKNWDFAEEFRNDLDASGALKTTSEKKARQLITQWLREQTALERGVRSDLADDFNRLADLEEQLARATTDEERKLIQDEIDNLRSQMEDADEALKRFALRQPAPAPAARAAEFTQAMDRATAVREALAEVVERFPSDMRVETFSSLGDLPNGLRADVMRGNAAVLANALKALEAARTPEARARAIGDLEAAKRGEAVEGFYSDGAIWVASYAVNPDAVLHHEIVHWLKATGRITDKELATLARRARKEGLLNEAIYREALAGRENIDALLTEEAAAVLIQARKDGRSFSRDTNRIIDKLLRLLERIGNGLRGRGFQTPDDVIKAILSGEIARREAVQAMMRQEDITAFAVRSGGESDLPMDEASRMARAREMGFDTSKVWYHGTGGGKRFNAPQDAEGQTILAERPLFDAFDDSMIGTANDPGHYGRGHYFVNSAGEASYYGERVSAYYVRGRFYDLSNYTEDLTFSGHFKSFAPKLDAIGALGPNAKRAYEAMLSAERYVNDNADVGLGVNRDGSEGYIAKVKHPVTGDEIDSFRGRFQETREAALNALRRRYIDEMSSHYKDVYPGLGEEPASLSDYVRVGGEVNAGDLTEKAKAAGYDGIIYGDELVVFNPANIRSVNAAFDPSKSDSPNLMFAFAGERARTADLEALNRAKEMEAEGKDRTAIWRETGWFKGVDGKWRFEIDDSGVRTLLPDTGLNIGRVDQLFAGMEGIGSAYPDVVAARAWVDWSRRRRSTEGSQTGNLIEVIGGTEEDMVSVGLHEVQHLIQGREAFAEGGSPEQANRMFAKVPRARQKTIQDANNIADFIARKMGLRFENDPQRWANAVDQIASGDYSPATIDLAKNVNRLQQEVEKLRLSFGTEVYRRLAGEVEARTVQKRMDMTPEERKARPPWEDYDVPEDQQIVRMGDGAMFSLRSEEVAPGIRTRPWADTPPPVPGMVVRGETMFAIRAFHGSPHDFDRFSMDKIGTGEGAQAYGFGLYFAESEGVANSYRSTLSYKKIRDDFLNALPEDADFDEVIELIGTGHFTPYQERVLKALNADDWLGFDFPSQAISAAYRNLDNYDPSPELRDAIAASGRLYEVNIRANPDEFLDWNKPLSQQSEKVRNAIEKAGLAPQEADLGTFGGFAVTSAPRWADTPEAAAALRESGIPGIRYLDQGSRAAGEGSRNYVVFDDSLIEITAKDGKPVPKQEADEILAASRSGGDDGPMFSLRQGGEAAPEPETPNVSPDIWNMARQIGARLNLDVSDAAGKSFDEQIEALEAFLRQAETASRREGRTAADDMQSTLDQMDELRYFADADAQELQKIAEDTISTITGAPAGRMINPFDPMFHEGRAGPLKARTLKIPDLHVTDRGDAFADFLDDDIERIAAAYVRTMAPDVAIAREFGDLDLSETMRQIQEDADRRTAQAPEAARKTAIQEESRRAQNDLIAIAKRLRGTFNLPQDPSNWGPWTARRVKELNVLRLMGSVLVASIPDVMKLLMVHGFRNNFDLLSSFVSNLGRLKVPKQEAKELSAGLEMVMSKAGQLWDSFADDFGGHSKFDRAMDVAVRKFGRLSLMDQWNSTLKQISGAMTVNRVLRASVDLANGRISQDDLTRFASSGISQDLALEIAAQYQKHGGVYGRLWLANGSEWDQTDLAQRAARALQAAVRREADMTIATPGQERPLWTSTHVGSVLAQFRTFQLITIQRTLIPALQESSAAAYTAMAGMVALGMLAEYLRAHVHGKEDRLPEDMGDWLYAGIANAGVLGWVTDVDQAMHKATRGNASAARLLFGRDQPISRFASQNVVGSLLGPTFGAGQDALTTLGAAASGEATQADIRAMRRLLPYQNLFWLSRALRAGEEQMMEGMGIPQRRN